MKADREAVKELVVNCVRNVVCSNAPCLPLAEAILEGMEAQGWVEREEE